jgi:serine/threonine protein kinase
MAVNHNIRYHRLNPRISSALRSCLCFLPLSRISLSWAYAHRVIDIPRIRPAFPHHWTIRYSQPLIDSSSHISLKSRCSSFGFWLLLVISRFSVNTHLDLLWFFSPSPETSIKNTKEFGMSYWKLGEWFTRNAGFSGKDLIWYIVFVG